MQEHIPWENDVTQGPYEVEKVLSNDRYSNILKIFMMES